MAARSHKFKASELTTLVETYKTYEPYLQNAEKVLTLGGILSACALSPLDDSNSTDLDYLVATVTNVLILGGWSRIDRDPTLLEGVCKAMRQLVIEHLPLLTNQALGKYFANSRRFTQFAKKDSNNGFRLHSGSDVLEDKAITEADACSIPNQALMAVIYHFCKEDGPVINDSDFLPKDGQSPAIEILKKLSDCLKNFSGDGLYLPVKLPDLVVITLLIERFALAASCAPLVSDRALLTEGVASLVGIILNNRPDELVSKDGNMFLADAPSSSLYESPAAKLLVRSLLKSIASRVPLDEPARKSVRDLEWAVIKNCLQVHVKHAARGYDNLELITGLLPHCTEKLEEPGALKGIRAEQQAMVVSIVSEPSLKKRLMVEYKKCRGHVLTNDLGM